MCNLGSSGDTQGTLVDDGEPLVGQGERYKERGKGKKEANQWNYYHEQYVHVRINQHHSWYFIWVEGCGGDTNGTPMTMDNPQWCKGRSTREGERQERTESMELLS